MAPTIHPGDRITVESATVTQASRGDIVVFARDGRLVVHRVTAMTRRNGEACLITRGDRARREDIPVSGPELIGRVSCIERGSSRVAASSRLNLLELVICRLLGFSDRATSLYLYFASRWNEIYPGGATCQP